MMALGRKVYQPIRYITERDSAIDKTSSDWAKYKASGYDWQYITLLPGEKATIFTLRQLTQRQRMAREGIENLAERLTFTLRCGIETIENYLIERPDGSVMELRNPEPDANNNLAPIATVKWAEDANFPNDHLIMIAAAISEISEAQIPLSKPFAKASGGGDTEKKNQGTVVAS
jgi:hypothetical protein